MLAFRNQHAQILGHQLTDQLLTVKNGDITLALSAVFAISLQYDLRSGLSVLSKDINAGIIWSMISAQLTAKIEVL